MTPARSMVVWVPDWAARAAAAASDDAPSFDEPLAVVGGGAVQAVSPAARAEGVRVGQRRRDAQARCPRLVVVDADPVREHRVFAPVIARLEELAPGVQLLAPGLCVLQAKGPARYYGGEAAAATVLAGGALDALPAAALEAGGAGVEAAVRVGVGDGPFTAEQAAREGTSGAAPVRLIPPDAGAAFLSALPVTVLDGAGGDALASLFARLGVHTLGQVAAIDPQRLVERFGPRGARLHALSSGRDLQQVTPRTPPPEFDRVVEFEPPVELADQVAFGVRVPAEQFTAGLGAQRLVCTALRVQIAGERGEQSERVWLHPAAFDAAAVVDRVRWQLAEQRLSSAVVRVRIVPETVDDAAHHTAVLFGSGPDDRVHHAFSRVQAMLGHRGVLTPALGGGRWLQERQVLVPWGDKAAPPQPRDRPWPGSLPDPLPATVFAAPVPVAVVDGDGDMVAVDGRGAVTAEPVVFVESGRSRRITGWAGPWPVIERGWDPVRARLAHRFQIVDASGAAWLLVCEAGGWQAEGRYD